MSSPEPNPAQPGLDGTPEELLASVLPYYSGMAASICREFGQQHMREDAISAMKIAIYSAAKKFDPARGIDFRAYVKLRAHGAVIDFLRGFGKRRPGAALTIAEQRLKKLLVETALSGRQIARSLNVAPQTVKNEANTLYLKERVNGRLELLLKYWRNRQPESGS